MLYVQKVRNKHLTAWLEPL